MPTTRSAPPPPDRERMREILRRVRRIEIRTRRTVNDVMAGEYHSVFKGRGMEFDEVREYAPGDEIRDIDWNVTARSGRPFVKRYVEEREQTVFFMADVSTSGLFGSQDRLKTELAAEVCAVLAFSAVKNNDRVGLLTFSDRVERLIPPKKGRKHALAVVRELLFGEAEGRSTDLPLAVDTLSKILKRRAIVFLVSDFLVPGLRDPLLKIDRRHDLVALRIEDPREASLPEAGILRLHDAETGRQISVDSSNRRLREDYARAWQQRSEQLERDFRRLKVDNAVLRTGEDYIDPLVQFFRRRARRY